MEQAAMEPRPRMTTSDCQKHRLFRLVDGLLRDPRRMQTAIDCIETILDTEEAPMERAARIVRDDGSGVYAYPTRVTCPSCFGSGGPSNGPVCRDCKGSGRVSDMLAGLIERQGN